MKLLLTCLLLGVAACGCTTKSRARSQAEAAYNAGRAAAYQQMLDEHRTTIRVLGNVRNPEFPWLQDLTLMEALVEADYHGSRDPRGITIIRKREPIPVDMKAFLGGEDVLLEPGDTIELRQ
ncbi:MAG TPA: hypothetical protein PKA41_16620 [Verrucomicrobiota bacterium]|nr:hypothetical protein [Verrucomicrobiota bacterium]